MSKEKKRTPRQQRAKKNKEPKLVPFLRDIAEAAGGILMKHFRGVLRIQKKEGAGIVTHADLASEKFLLKEILTHFPDSEVITEESGLHKRAGSRYRWIIDPLDGTSNYAHGFPWFCVSIGVEIEGQLSAGAIYHPCLKELFWAERGKGAYLNNKRIHVSKTEKLEDSLLSTGFYYFKGRDLDAEMERFGRVQEQVQAVRRPGAAALDLAYVACGRFDGFWERGLSAWDVAAGIVIINEAGGRVTNYKGGEVSVTGSEILASNSIVHEGLSKLL